VVQIVLWYLDSGCSKHMTGNHAYLMIFVSKFLGTVRFENDQIARIMGYDDYQLGKVVQIVLWYLDSGCSKHMTGNHSHLMNFVSKFLGTVRFENDQIARIIGKFCDAELEVAFRKNTCCIRDLEGLVSNPVFQQPCIPPNRDDWDYLFQSIFDEYFNPLTIAVSPVQEATAPRAEVSADSHVSISISQDAPSASIPSSQAQEHSPIISQRFEESPKTPTFHDDPLNKSLQDSPSQASSSNVIQIHTPFEHLGR
nr:hypothetical protein [Tanacetum cinerariifolium]